MWFNSSDHLPPHFHASRPGEWEIRVYFTRCGHRLEYEIKWKIRVPRHAHLKQLLEGVRVHRVQLLGEWERKVQIPEELDDI